MSNTIGNVIADSLSLGLGYADRLLTDVSAETFAHLARPGENIIESNHGAFIYGHLTLYAPRIIGELGGDTSAFPITEGDNALFSKDANCQHDSDGSIYPPMHEITDRFKTYYLAAMQQLRESNDETFSKPNPAGGRLTELFPTLGSVHAFYAGGHLMLHMGQMSAWRRMSGLGPA